MPEVHAPGRPLGRAALDAATRAAAPPMTARELEQRAANRNAVDAVVWGMPAVNADLMRQEMLAKTAARDNQIVYWGRALDWRNQTLTPNPDAIYLMTFFDTKDVGPVVLEIPPAGPDGSINANIVTWWQMALEDVGAFGVDKGAGGKFVFVPPGYDGAIPAGYAALGSDTPSGYALIRSTLQSHGDADVAAAIAYGKRVKVYPLSAAANPPATVFVDAKDVLFDSTIPYDMRFFQALDRAVQSQGWIDRDRVMIDKLRSVGIERGEPFAPDAAAQKQLSKAAGEARSLLEARYDRGFPPFFSGTQWMYPTHPEAIEAQGSGYADPDKYAVEKRGLLYSYGYIALKRPGAAQFYLVSIRDKTGQAYDGRLTYRLRVPANPPVEQYWSVTAYDRATHALIKNMPRASRASNAAEVKANADGSVDVYFAPQAPPGQEANWVPTDPGRRFELMFRVYGPRKAFFDKVWALPDVERVEAQ